VRLTPTGPAREDTWWVATPTVRFPVARLAEAPPSPSPACDGAGEPVVAGQEGGTGHVGEATHPRRAGLQGDGGGASALLSGARGAAG
jgi:hypothetical protein